MRSPTSDLMRPTRLGFLATVQGFRRDPFALFTDIAARLHGIATAHAPGMNLVFITHPDHVHHVLQENHQNYDKNAIIYNNARPLLGDGLPVAHGGEEWFHRRRLMQPAFHRRNTRLVTDVTEDCLVDMLADWDRMAESGQRLDIALRLTGLTMRIIGRILFDNDVTTDAPGIARRFERVSLFLAKPFPPLFVPTRRNRAFHADMRHINEFVAEVVRVRQADSRRHDDLLDLLIDSRRDPSGGLSPRQLRDELVSMFFAGHDTLAHTLAWALYLLAEHPDADQSLHKELSTVLSGRPATAADLPSLPYTRAVINEAMRLFPAVWVMMRRAIGGDIIAGYRIPRGALVTWSPYVGNRDPQLWADPEMFQPERFLTDREALRCRHAVLPFGEGPRVCMGSDFAMAGACLILATLAQHHRVELLPEHPVRPATGITLHPAGGLWGRLRRRSLAGN